MDIVFWSRPGFYPQLGLVETGLEGLPLSYEMRVSPANFKRNRAFSWQETRGSSSFNLAFAASSSSFSLASTILCQDSTYGKKQRMYLFMYMYMIEHILYTVYVLYIQQQSSKITFLFNLNIRFNFETVHCKMVEVAQ